VASGSLHLARICAVSLVVALAGPATASASLPAAATNAAQDVTSSSATLRGTVNPNNEATTWYFEYGTTKAYGSRTDNQGPTGATKGNIPVTAPVSGLASATTYHFRLVAGNGSGTKLGGDKTFKTTTPVSLVASPARLTFSHPTALSGQVGGAKVAGVKVTLQQVPAPYDARDFKAVATATTDAAGRFSFTQTPGANVAYRVVTATNPRGTSPTVIVGVRNLVTLSLSTAHPKRGRTVVFRGTVGPRRDGQLVRIQKRVSRGWRTVARGVLGPATNPQLSSFSVRARVRRNGVYRAYVGGDAANLPGWSRRRAIRVH
jgi:hypothetical protein